MLVLFRSAPAPMLLKFILAALGFGGSLLMLTELLLIKHYRQPLQLVALGAAITGLTISFVPALMQHRVARVATFLLSLGLMLAGVVGTTVHFLKNAAVIKSSNLLEVLAGPYPALAPLALANIGVVIALSVWVSARED
jgi:hypothetical protein